MLAGSVHDSKGMESGGGKTEKKGKKKRAQFKDGKQDGQKATESRDRKRNIKQDVAEVADMVID